MSGLKSRHGYAVVLCPRCDGSQPTYGDADGRLKRFSGSNSVLPGPLNGQGDGVVEARPVAVAGVYGASARLHVSPG